MLVETNGLRARILHGDVGRSVFPYSQSGILFGILAASTVGYVQKQRATATARGHLVRILAPLAFLDDFPRLAAFEFPQKAHCLPGTFYDSHK